MAVVPMADGPKVQATIPDKPELGLVKTKGDVVLKEADQRLQQSTGEFMEACNRAYETMSRARADAAMNDIQIQVNDLMKGDGGALNQLGTEVVDRPDAPYVQHYDQQIGKIIHDATQNLDVHQKALIGEKLKQYRADRRLELQNHAIKQADAYQKSVAQTKSEIAAEGIAVDPGNIRSVEEKSKDIEDAYRVMHRGEPEESVAKGIKDAVSASLVAGIEALLANDQPEKAQGVLRHYRGGKLTAYDAIKIQGRIRDALQKKAAAAMAASAAQATADSLKSANLVSTILAPATGKDYDDAAFTRTSTIVSDAGKPEWAAQAYLVGEAKAKELVGDWQKRVEEAKAKGDNAALEKLNKEDPLAASFTPEQSAAYKRFSNELSLVNTGNKEAIKRQVAAANPNMPPKMVDRVANEIHAERANAERVRRVELGQKAVRVFTMLHGGQSLDQVPPDDLNGFTDKQRAGFAEYARRRKLDSFVTDSALYYSLAYDNQRLKSLDWADLYAMAGSFTPNDFNALVNRKAAFESGGDISNDSRMVTSAVEDSLKRLGYRKSGADGTALFSRMSRVVNDAIMEKYTADNGKGWDGERVRQEVAKLANTGFIQPGTIWDSPFNYGELITGEALYGTDNLNDLIDAALKATGYPDPNKTDRTEWMLSYLTAAPSRPLPGEAAFYQRALVLCPEEVKEVVAGYREVYGQAPTAHDVVRAMLQKRTSAAKEEKKSRPATSAGVSLFNTDTVIATEIDQ